MLWPHRNGQASDAGGFSKKSWLLSNQDSAPIETVAPITAFIDCRDVDKQLIFFLQMSPGRSFILLSTGSKQ